MAKTYNTLILGAGAAGMMCAAHAGPDTLIIDHAKTPGEKIRISGGGRCNFTNLNTAPQNFLSENRHFAKSALSRYTQHDFVKLVERHAISYHEKTLGQLFCDISAKQIIEMLLSEMKKAGAELRLKTKLNQISTTQSGFKVTLEKEGCLETVNCRNFVVACGGKSIPKMGASGLGYMLAEQFGHTVTEIRPALVPLTFSEDIVKMTSANSGVGVDASVRCGKTTFDEAILFTHRGLSGPAILQISSYWREGVPIVVDLVPGTDLFDDMKASRSRDGKKAIYTCLNQHLPKNLATDILNRNNFSGNLADQSNLQLKALHHAVNGWELHPIGSEGYRTAEVTLGGVDTKKLSSKTMQSKLIPGLYFIGEVVDVTGWLGGYNFQWAWSSGWVAGNAIASNLQRKSSDRKGGNTDQKIVRVMSDHSKEKFEWIK